MAIGLTLVIVVATVLVIWLLVEVKRMRHKIFAIFLITLILFSYFSFTYVVKKHDVELGSVSGLVDATGLYFSWLGSLFGNFKTITANAIKMDWKGKNVDKNTTAIRTR